MNADGSEQTRLTTDPATDGSPAWSPDGKQLVFISDRNTENFPNLFIMDANGENVRRLANLPSGVHSPTWSPDGRQIAFDSNNDIYVIDVDGSDLRRLTQGPTSDGNPIWSPDSEQILFVSDRGGQLDVYLMNLDTGDIQQLTTKYWVRFPTMRWDTQELVWWDYLPVPDSVNLELFLYNLETGEYFQLTENPEDDVSPSWSPDGRRIAYSSTVNGETDIYLLVMDEEGENE